MLDVIKKSSKQERLIEWCWQIVAQFGPFKALGLGAGSVGGGCGGLCSHGDKKIGKMRGHSLVIHLICRRPDAGLMRCWCCKEVVSRTQIWLPPLSEISLPEIEQCEQLWAITWQRAPPRTSPPSLPRTHTATTQSFPGHENYSNLPVCFGQTWYFRKCLTNVTKIVQIV